MYQVYVRSWSDRNGDGYGDLPGVTARLDYLSWLGLAGIWLSPTMPLPDNDWGYDVSDYCAVHPELGTLDDLDTLIAEAAKRDIKILLDLAPNHTSSAHPWFTDAVSGPGAACRQFYVSGQYYLHSFLPSMPDLNWWEPDVHDAFAEILRFWFARGVAGFRIGADHPGRLRKDG